MILIIGFLFMVLIFAGLSAITGMGPGIIDFPSALLVIIPLVFFFLVTKSGKNIGRYLKSSFRKDHTYTITELKAVCAAADNSVKFIYGIGAFGFLFGIVGALMYLENKEALGPNLAISLITLLYAIGVSAFMFLPLKFWAENKLIELKDC